MKKAFPSSSRRVKVILAAVTVLSIFNAAAIAYMLQRSQTQPDNTLAILIDRAVKESSQPLAVDPVTKLRYVPEASYVLPAAPTDLGGVNYAYFGNMVNISSAYDVSAASSPVLGNYMDTEKMFSYVPHLQACSRGVSVFNYKQQDVPTQEKRLRNGDIIYYGQDKDCRNDALLAYVKQIESY